MRTLKVLKYFLSIIVFSFIISSCTPGFNNNKRKSSGDGCEEAFFCIEGFFSNASLFDFLIPKVYAQAVTEYVGAAVRAPIGVGVVGPIEGPSFFDACPNADKVRVSDCLSLFDKCAVLYVNDEVNCVTKVDSSNNKYQFIYKVNPNFSAESIFRIEIVANNPVGAGRAAVAGTGALRTVVSRLSQLEGIVNQNATLKTTIEAPSGVLAFKNSAFNNLLFDWDQLNQKIADYFSTSLGVTGSNNDEIIKNAFNSGYATTFLNDPSLFAQEVLAPTIASLVDSDKALALCNGAMALNDVQKLAEQIAVLVPLNNYDINFCLPSVLEKFASDGSTGDLGIAYQALQNGDLNACSAISMVSSLNLSAVDDTGVDVTSMVTTLTSSPLYTDNCASMSAGAGRR